MNGALRILVAAQLALLFVTLPPLAHDRAESDGVLEWGDVRFPHELHFSELDVECVSCHHETNATALATPHSQYFDDFWINCRSCHAPSGAPAAATACSSCHHDSPTDLADETLSTKVVIHKVCWQCHEVGRGAEASGSCVTCHDGARRNPSDEAP